MTKYNTPQSYDALLPIVDANETEQAQVLGELLYNVLAPRSVIDIGCATGIYLLPFKERGVHVHGVDWAPGGGKWIPGDYEIADLRSVYAPAQYYDLALCIEVGEHLEARYAENLTVILAWSAYNVFFSAATPGQGGCGHYNEQPVEYWDGLFSRRNYHRDAEVTALLHKTIDTHPAFKKCGWLIPHSTLYRSRDSYVGR